MLACDKACVVHQRVAVPSAEASAFAREAVETGSVTRTGARVPALEMREPIRHEGAYYLRDKVKYPCNQTGVLVGRAIAFLTGLGCVALGGRTYPSRPSAASGAGTRSMRPSRATSRPPSRA